MDFATLAQAIGSLGFPIAACCGLFWYMTKQQEQHKTEMDKLSEALNNNTVVMTKIYEKLGGEENV